LDYDSREALVKVLYTTEQGGKWINSIMPYSREELFTLLQHSPTVDGQIDLDGIKIHSLWLPDNTYYDASSRVNWAWKPPADFNDVWKNVIKLPDEEYKTSYTDGEVSVLFHELWSLNQEQGEYNERRWGLLQHMLQTRGLKV
jgi:hypothetical protein